MTISVCLLCSFTAHITGMRNSCRRHAGINPAETLDSAACHRRHLFRYRSVNCQSDCLASSRSDFICDRASAFQIDIGDHDFGALFSEAQTTCSPNPRCAAGNNCNLVSHTPSHHKPPNVWTQCRYPKRSLLRGNRKLFLRDHYRSGARGSNCANRQS